MIEVNLLHRMQKKEVKMRGYVQKERKKERK
jgi:hypothetical protein